MKRPRCTTSHGFTVIEMLMVLALFTVTSLIAALNIKQFNDPLLNASAQILSFVKQVRAEAIGATSAVILSAQSDTRIITLFGTTCSDPTPIEDTSLVLQLEDGAHLMDTGWELCFNSRGFPDANFEIEVQDAGGTQKVVEVLLGGAARIQ